MERKLTAIFCADVFGYSRLTGENEEATHRTLTAYRKIIDALIEQHHGRFVHSAGDSVLAEFVSVVNAVQCAVEVQATLKAENATLPAERRMEFRIGINLGDVIADGVEIYGDGVNVAARLESLADPGAIFVSGTVREHLGNKLPIGYTDLGEQSVKNIAHPVRVFRVLPEAGATERTATKARGARKYVRRGAFSLVGLGIIAATIVLVQHLSLRPPKTAASIPPSEKPALPLPSIPSIAVLPFANLSGDPGQDYFSDGVTDELINELSRIRDLFVIGRASTFAYKGKAVSEPDLSHELGVKFVLEGSVLRVGNRVRVMAQLVDAARGVQMWSERYDRPLHDIFALQDEVVKRIVTTLNLQLAVSEQGFLPPRRMTNSLEAYDLALRGMDYYSNLTKESNAKARQMFEEAVTLDPGYADAYAEIGVTYWWDWIWQWSADPMTLNRAFEAEQRAVQLDDQILELIRS